MIGADFQHNEVEGAVRSADVDELRCEPCISRKEDLATLGLDDPRGPECLVVAGEAAAREVLGGCGREAEAVHLDALVPVELRNEAWLDTKFFEVFEIWGALLGGGRLVVVDPTRCSPQTGWARCWPASGSPCYGYPPGYSNTWPAAGRECSPGCRT